MEVAQIVDVSKQALPVQGLFLVRHSLPGGVVGMDLIQIVSSPVSVEVEAGMGYPRILID
jgi:hypothetical protein